MLLERITILIQLYVRTVYNIFSIQFSQYKSNIIDRISINLHASYAHKPEYFAISIAKSSNYNNFVSCNSEF